MVIGQIGQTLDGRVATEGGRGEVINGAAAIVHLHRLRALVDAVVIGVGTALADDPRLTVRNTSGQSPARVILDPTGRLNDAALCLVADGARRIVVTTVDRSFGNGVETIRHAGPELVPAAILETLVRQGFDRVLIEGGPKTLSRFLAAGALDRLHVMIAPIILGSGQPGVQLPTAVSIAGAIKPATASYVLPEGDVLFDCDLRRP
ncbi:MAG: RibD family protein [Alphaproteobacteria bacterium]|nr:RibD family protein [Alphaproteobacteria bacterium]